MGEEIADHLTRPMAIDLYPDRSPTHRHAIGDLVAQFVALGSELRRVRDAFPVYERREDRCRRLRAQLAGHHDATKRPSPKNVIGLRRIKLG